jgi:hypothetical protein
MTDPGVLQGCTVRSHAEVVARPVGRVSHHAAQRYLERVEGRRGPFADEDLKRAEALLLELFDGRTPSNNGAGGGMLSTPYNGAAALHAGRIHVLAADGTIITVLSLGAPTSGCACKTCARLRRKASAKGRRSTTTVTREGMQMELAAKQPVHRKQLLRGQRSAGRAGHGATLRDRLVTS